jgi:hypothetical protein
MHEQRPKNKRTRCKRHGLVMNNDGACPLCVRPKNSTRRFAKSLTIGTLLAVTVAISVGWRSAKSSDSDRAAADSSTTDFTVRLARTPSMAAADETSTGSASAAIVENAIGPGAEENGPGTLPLQPSETVVASPEPPRASVDPEPEAADDPRDFELPQK